MNERFTLKPLKPIHAALGGGALLSCLLGFVLWINPFFPSFQPTNYSNQELEELWNQVENESNLVSKRLEAWIKYADATSVYSNRYGYPDAVKKRSLLSELKKITEQDDKLRIMYQYLVGEYYWKIGDANMGMNAFKRMEAQVDSLWPSYPDKRMIYHHLGVLSGELGEPYIATDYLLKCIQECEKIGDQYLLGLAYWNIAIQYGHSGEYEKEANYLDEAMVLAKKLEYPYLMANILSVKSMNYHDQGIYDLADSLYNQTITFCKRKDLEFIRYLTLLNYGILKLDEGNYNRAFTYFDHCKEYFNRIENLALMGATTMQFAALSLETNELEGVYKSLLKTEALQEQLGLQNDQAQSNNLLSQYYQIKGDYLQALKHSQKYHKIENGILRRVSLTKMLRQEELRHKGKIEKERIIQYGLCAGLFLVLLSLFFAIRGFFIKQKANQKIQEQKKQLEQLNIAKDRILNIIAHDLKKPMISFRGIGQKVNYLLKKEDHQRLIALGEDLDKEVNTLNALVDNLLKWAMLQKNILPQLPEEVLLSPIVDQVFDLFKKSAIQKSVTLIKSIPSNHKAIADSNILSSILRNLVDNAIKFSNPNDTICIESKLVNGMVHIEVKDTGTGIAPDQLRQLFLLKKEKSTVGTSGEMGAGLGLHLVKELITQCKGKIEVMSQIGQGTSFLIYLPTPSATSYTFQKQ